MFASASLLKKFITRYLTVKIKETDQFCRTICQVLNKSILLKDVTDLRVAILSYDGLIDAGILALYIRGIKDYLHSRDLQFNGKYIKTSYLFGALSYQSESEQVKKLDHCLDELATQFRHQPQAKAPTISRLKKPSSFNFFSSCAMLLISLAVVTATRTKVKFNLPNYNQSPFLPEPTSFMQEVDGRCYPAEELLENYDLVYNVPLRDVEQFFWVEIHDDFHKQFNKDHANRIARTGDIASIEAYSIQNTYRCSELNLREDLICRGLEDIALYNKVAAQGIPIQQQYDKANQLWPKYAKLIEAKLNELPKVPTYQHFMDQTTEICNLLDELVKICPEQNVLALTHLQETRQGIEKINILLQQSTISEVEEQMKQVAIGIQNTIKDVSDLMTYIEQRYEQLGKEEDTVIKRNLPIIKEIHEIDEFNKKRREEGSLPRQHHVFFGVAHAIPNEARRGKRPFNSIEKTDPQFKLRLAASKVPSVIAYPRKKRTNQNKKARGRTL